MTKYVKSKCRDPEFIAFPFASKAKVQCNCSLNSNSHSVSIFHLFLNGKEIKTNFSNSRPLNLYLLFFKILSIYVTIPPPYTINRAQTDLSPLAPLALSTDLWPATSGQSEPWPVDGYQLTVECQDRQTCVCVLSVDFTCWVWGSNWYNIEH